jgi:hypothetical protein
MPIGQHSVNNLLGGDLPPHTQSPPGPPPPPQIQMPHGARAQCLMMYGLAGSVSHGGTVVGNMPAHGVGIYLQLPR